LKISQEAERRKSATMGLGGISQESGVLVSLSQDKWPGPGDGGRQGERDLAAGPREGSGRQAQHSEVGTTGLTLSGSSLGYAAVAATQRWG
jgi:hypothetical protein